MTPACSRKLRRTGASTLSRRVSRALANLDDRGARELSVNAADALDLSLGGKTLVEPLCAERSGELAPGREPFLPALDPPVDRFCILASEIRADAQHRFESDGACDHVAAVAPSRVPGFLRRAPKIPDDVVEAL